MSGLIVGGFAGVLRGSTPFLFALASGIQWFTLGSTFWGKWVLDSTSLISLTNLLQLQEESLFTLGEKTLSLHEIKSPPVL